MSPEFLSLISLLVCFASILSLLYFFGKEGLFAYTTMAVIISNIQVLKLTQYSFLTDPVALGTIVFSSSFAVDNILTEFFGRKTAQKNTFMSFFTYLAFVILIQITIAHPNIQSQNCINLHDEVKAVFSPSLVIFISSAAAYLCGQLFDIFVFASLKKLFKSKYLALRSLISMACSTFLDNLVFSMLAWIILADNPISWKEMLITYVYITYLIRLSVAVLSVPIVQLAGWMLERKEANVRKF